MRILVVTTSTRRARWKVLERSVLSVHPEADVRALWCDARLSAPPAASVVTPHGLDLDGDRWADLVLALGERRAGWAALPWVVDHLRGEGGEGAADEPLVVLDDGFVVLDALDDLVRDAKDTPVVRARHVDVADGSSWGGALPGVVVVPVEADDFLGWWRQRARDAARSVEDGAEPWWEHLDGTVTSADPAFRLSPRTAGELELTIGTIGEVDRVLVGDRTVSLVDFGGVDPRSPWWYAAPDEEPTALVGETPALRQLCHAHADRLLEAGWTEGDDAAPADALAGVRLTAELRAWYRSLLADTDRGAAPPNPYVAGEVRAFVDLLAGPGDHDGTGVSLHADQVYESRADLQGAFAHPRWRDRTSFRRWLWSNGLIEHQSALLTLPEPPRPAPLVEVTRERRPFGVNLVGYLGADLGLGVAARQMQRALESAGVPTSTISYDRTSSNQRTRSPGLTERPYHFNLMLIVPDQLPLFVGDVGADFLSGHHNIGLWYWESDTLTPHQELAFDHVDEVWAATTYLRDAFAVPGRVPVALVPSPLVFHVPSGASDDRGRLGLDDRFTFLFSFDFLSVVARKNPLGLVDAYSRAFGPEDGARLVLKSINGHVFPKDRERLIDAVADRVDIEVWDRLLPGSDRLALLAAADCYVSLHRSEGLGLTMAESMAVGTPVIATAYSGNLDFMDERSALLVPAEEVLVGPGNYYPPEGHWAEPDLDGAAELMRSVREDAALRRRLVDAGRRAIEPFTYERVGAIARDRLIESWRG